MTIFLIIMTLISVAVVIWTFYDLFKELFMSKTVFEDGYTYIQLLTAQNQQRTQINTLREFLRGVREEN